MKNSVLRSLLLLLFIGFVFGGLVTGLAPLPSSAEGSVEKLTADDLTLYVYEGGTSDVHVRKANEGYKYALLNGSGQAITDWTSPEDGRVVFQGQDVNKGYYVVNSPDAWAEETTPDDWKVTGIHFDIPDFDDAIEKTFVNPQDVERSKDGTIIWIYDTRKECEYALYDFYTDKLMTDWKDGVASVVVFTGLERYRTYDVRARIKGTGPLPVIIPSKTLPEPGADVIVGESSFDDLSGYGLINIWASPGYGYAILGKSGKPLTLGEMLQWNVFVKDQYEEEIHPDEKGYYHSEKGGRITFSVPAGGTYRMGGIYPDGKEFDSKQSFQVKGVNHNYWYEYVVPKEGGSGFYRLVIAPACPYSIYKLSATHSFIHFIDRYERVQPGGDDRVYFSPVNSFLDFVITAQPIPLEAEGEPEAEGPGGDISGEDALWGDVSGGDADAFLVKAPPEGFQELKKEDVKRSGNGEEITVYGSDGQQYVLADPVTNMPIGPWGEAKNGRVDFHSLDPLAPYLVLTQLQETESTGCVIQPQGIYVPGVNPRDVSGGNVSGGDVGGAPDGAPYLTVEMYQGINGGKPVSVDRTVQFGDLVSYYLVARNDGNADASDAVVTDRIPDGMTLVEGSVSGGGVYDPDTRTITWRTSLEGTDAGENEASAAARFQFQVRVDRADWKTSYNNTAYIAREGAAPGASNVVRSATAAMTILKELGGADKDSGFFFLFALHLVPSEERGFDPGKIVCSNGRTTFDKSEKGDYVAYFSLWGGQRIEFIGLPADATYQMIEHSANMDGYETKVGDTTGEVLTDEWGEYGGEGKIPEDGSDTWIYFLNTKKP